MQVMCKTHLMWICYSTRQLWAAFITTEDGASRGRSLGRLNTHLLGVCLWKKFGCCERWKLQSIGCFWERFCLTPSESCQSWKFVPMTVSIFVSSWRWIWWTALLIPGVIVIFLSGKVLCSENARDIKRAGVYSHNCGLPWCHKPAGWAAVCVMVRPKLIQLSWVFKRNSSLLLTMFLYRSWDCEKQNLLFHFQKSFPSFSVLHSLTHNSLVSHCRERICLLLG